jgi:hypothetical protein
MAPWLSHAFEMNQPFWLIVNRYPFGEHVEKMRSKHPDWTDRQLSCCLYWQGTARKQLDLLIKEFWVEHPGARVARCPEAMGLDVTATLKSVGVEIQWPPRDFALQVALAGTERLGGEDG